MCFPEVLLVDATHRTNSEHFKLFSFMVQDSFGLGQHVEHALITDERSDMLRHAIAYFKRSNPARTKSSLRGGRTMTLRR
ncbi:hypothetical protein JG688_00014131 [Phytophthora aleatoria]|uniref:ZSWIM1/3 RNaseH-like domain-containing protein n=1 Tax=Phytophthora aleatoria TaxID=2496075 RepID=A0A8J5ICC7_9STRA|nr:hypothetical protein JG688_00014131 [Phytophthora aleatoria]